MAQSKLENSSPNKDQGKTFQVKKFGRNLRKVESHANISE
jgi:hypothetical protein